MVTIQVELVNSNLNCNLILGCTWTNDMVFVVYALFHLLCFPKQGKRVIENQLDFFPSESSAGNIPYVRMVITPYEYIRLGMFKDSSLMGVFPLPLMNIASINMI